MPNTMAWIDRCRECTCLEVDDGVWYCDKMQDYCAEVSKCIKEEK